MSDTPQKTRFMELLNQHGVRNSPASASHVWEAFKDYGREIYGPESIGLLFQIGVYDFTGEQLFYFDPLFQFEKTDEEGEHDHFEQLHCELTCKPNNELKDISTNLWSFDYKTVDEFFAAVEALPEFKISMNQENYNIDVSHEDV